MQVMLSVQAVVDIASNVEGWPSGVGELAKHMNQSVPELLKSKKHTEAPLGHVSDETVRGLCALMYYRSEMRIDLNSRTLTSSRGLSLMRGLTSNVTSLMLGGTGLADGNHMQHMELLGIALKDPACRIHYINLARCGIGPEAGKLLGEAMAENSSVTKLLLNQNKVGDLGGAALSRALETNSTLTKLNLNGNAMSDDVSVALRDALCKNSTLITLNLGGNKFKDATGFALGKALEVNATLQYMWIGDANIRGAGGVALAEAFAKNKSLKWFYMGDHKSGMDVGKAFGRSLETNKSLERWVFGGNHVYNDGARVIFDAIKTNQTIKMLGLCDNKFDDEIINVMIEALKINTSLIKINLKGNAFSAKGMEKLYAAIAERKVSLELLVDKIEDLQMVQKKDKPDCVIIPMPSGNLAKDQEIIELCTKAQKILSTSGVQAWIDRRKKKTTSQKFSSWEARGVKRRIEIGSVELARGCCIIARCSEKGKVKRTTSVPIDDSLPQRFSDS